jgi:predicted Mrr-cat superfamily restriction endonuclease
LGWSVHEDVSRISTFEEMLRVVEDKRQELLKVREKPGQYRSYASQLHAFVNNVSVGDFVLAPATPTENVLLGRILGRYEFRAGLIDPEHLPISDGLRGYQR